MRQHPSLFSHFSLTLFFWCIRNKYVSAARIRAQHTVQYYSVSQKLTSGLSNANLEVMARVNVRLSVVLSVRTSPLCVVLQREKRSQLQQASDLPNALVFLSEHLMGSVRDVLYFSNLQAS
jgi:hypothetical protein